MKYKIHLLSNWHTGSGLSAGAESDAEVLKDDNHFPYIPGKTIKGLLKDALEEMPNMDGEIIKSIFGYEERDKEEEKTKEEKVIRTHKRKAFFSNATLGKAEREEITPKMADFLYRNVSSTKINKNGVAENKNLRTMEVCVPIVLEGEISGLEDEKEQKAVTNALKWVRHLGVNRNRGLGRCKFIVEPEKERKDD